MKNGKFFLLFGLMVLMLAPFLIFAQDIDPPNTVIQWFGLLPLYLGSIVGVAVSVPFWTAIFVGVFNDPSKQWKYIMTGLVTLILLVLALVLDFGYLHGAYWWWVIPNFVGIMIASILGYAIPFIKTILDAVADKFNPWKQ